MDWHSNLNSLKPPLHCRHAHSLELFLGILPLNPAFSSIILFHMFVQSFSPGDEVWKILFVGHCFFCIFENSGKNTGQAFSGCQLPLSRAQQPQISQYLDATLWLFN